VRAITEGTAAYPASKDATPDEVAPQGAQPAKPTAAVEPAAAERRNLDQLEIEAQQRYGLRPIEDDGADVAREPAIAANTSTATLPRSDISHEHPAPEPPFWGSRVVEHIPIKAALGFLNETMLFQVQWGFRKKGRAPEEWQRYLATEVRPHYHDLVQRCEQGNILEPKAVYGYWPCNSDGDDLVIYEPPAKAASENGSPAPRTLSPLTRFSFPRQKKTPYWCLADFFRPAASGQVDVVAFHVVTAGQRVSEVAREWFARNEYQQYLFLHGLGVETAEALAEYMHKQVRAELGAGKDDARDRQALFKQGYRGSRFSFGYPACPNLEDQVGLMRLLVADRIGVTLSDEFQLDPEQSTSALITLHPAARYFNVR
jgi:5-methyltetrahydrofolate--homocysteine methyltransferase